MAMIIPAGDAVAGDLSQVSRPARAVRDDVHKIAADLAAGHGCTVDFVGIHLARNRGHQRLVHLACQLYLGQRAKDTRALLPQESHNEDVPGNDRQHRGRSQCAYAMDEGILVLNSWGGRSVRVEPE